MTKTETLGCKHQAKLCEKRIPNEKKKGFNYQVVAF